MNLPFAIERLRDVLRRQHKSLSTEASYAYWLRHYVNALKTMAGERRNGTKLEPDPHAAKASASTSLMPFHAS